MVLSGVWGGSIFPFRLIIELASVSLECAIIGKSTICDSEKLFHDLQIAVKLNIILVSF